MVHFFLKTLILLACCAWFFVAEAQTADTVRRIRVEKYIWGVETGLFGAWGYYERRLVDQVTLRGEVSWFSPTYAPKGTVSGGFASPLQLIPGISVEPRWYYNLDKKMRKANNIIAGSSGNFISLQMRYMHDMFLPSPDNSLERGPAVSVLFMWGIRHDIGFGFNCEWATNVGFLTFPDRSFALEVYFEPYLRIGYRFVDNKK